MNTVEHKSRKRRKRRSSKDQTGSNQISQGIFEQYRIFRAGRRFIRFVSTTPFFALLPVFLLLLSTSTDYYVALEGYNNINYLTFGNLPTRDEPDVIGRAQAEQIKTQVQAPIFLFILCLSLLYARKLIRFFWAIPALAILPLYLFTTSIQSFDPGRVISNSILASFAMLAAAVFAINQHGRANALRNLYMVVFTVFFLHQTASLVLYLSVGMDVLAFLASENRVGGFSGNPNSLANHAVIGIWAAVSLGFSPRTGFFTKIFCLVGFFVFFLNIQMSGSGTGVLAGLTVIVISLGFNLLSRFSGNVRVLVSMLFCAFLLLAASALAIFYTPEQLFVATTESLGKDATLTGRTDIWEVGRAAIAEKFWFGWGYDNHSSVKSTREFSIPFAHFHNGFLDTTISGGILLLLLVLACFWYFLSRFVMWWYKDFQIYPLASIWLLLVILNLSEYSLLRPHSQVWLIFLCALSYVVAWRSNLGVLLGVQIKAPPVQTRISAPNGRIGSSTGSKLSGQSRQVKRRRRSKK